MKKTSEETTVSVVIPAYNAAETIAEALLSVAMQHEAGCRYEILVADDGSTDGTEKIVKKFLAWYPDILLKYLQQPNSGVSAARNLALRHATGDYIALLDADDVWLPNKTKSQLDAMSRLSQYDLVAGKRSNQTIRWPYRVNNGIAQVSFDQLLLRTEIHPSTIMFRRGLLDVVKGFDPEQNYAEDVNFCLKASLHKPLLILDEKVVIAGGEKRTFGVSGLSANLPAMHRGYLKNLREMYRLNAISFVRWAWLVVFYQLKYHLLQIRKRLNT